MMDSLFVLVGYFSHDLGRMKGKVLKEAKGLG